MWQLKIVNMKPSTRVRTSMMMRMRFDQVESKPDRSPDRLIYCFEPSIQGHSCSGHGSVPHLRVGRPVSPIAHCPPKCYDSHQSMVQGLSTCEEDSIRFYLCRRVSPSPAIPWEYSWVCDTCVRRMSRLSRLVSNIPTCGKCWNWR